MALTRDMRRGRCWPPPILEYDAAAANVRWFEGQPVQQGSDGILRPLVAGGRGVGVSESSIDYTAETDGAKQIKIRCGVWTFRQSSTFDEDTQIGQPVYWDVAAELATASDAGGANPFLGEFVRCNDDGKTVQVLVMPASSGPGSLLVMSKTITHADLTAVALTQAIAIGTPPAGYHFLSGAKDLTANFTGGGSTSVSLDVGGTDADGLIAADDVFAGPLAEDFAPTGAQVAVGYMANLGGQTINATFTSDVTVDLLTAGSVTLRLAFVRAS